MATDIDRLFRENLDQVEMTPSAEGWEQVKNQLTKKRPVWVIPMRIAATVSLVVVASLLVLNTGDEQTGSYMISKADHPVPAVLSELKLSTDLIAKAETPATESKSTVVPVPRTDKQPSTEEPVEDLEPMNTLTVAGIQTKMLEVKPVDQAPGLLGQKHKSEMPSIRITYIASNEPAEATEKNGKLSNLISLAKEVTKADLLADIRDAKDNLFNKN